MVLVLWHLHDFFSSVGYAKVYKVSDVRFPLYAIADKVAY